jgi:O-antigen/teichoic acid export membrane protein
VALLATRLLYKQAVDYFQYTRRFLNSNLGSIASSYLFVALLAAAAWQWGALDLDTLLLLQTSAMMLVALPLAAQLVREMGWPRLRLPWRRFAADARIGLPLTGELIIDFLLRSSDRYLILLYLSVSDVGRYQPAYTVGSIAIFLVSMTETILLPALSRLVDLGRRDDATALMAAVLRLFLMLAAPMVIGALMTGPSLTALLATPEIGAASRWVTPLVAAATIFYGVARLASTAALVIGRTPAILMANAVGAAVNLLLNLALLPLLRSITLPAATTLLGYAVGYICIAWALRPLWPIDIDWRAMLRYLLASVGMGGFLWYVGFRAGEVAGMSMPALAASIAAGMACYFLLLFLLGGLGRHELAQLASLARRRIPDAE